MTGSFHQRYLALVDEIEHCCLVADWRFGDVEIWPLARMDLYLDMYWQSVGGQSAGAPSRAARAFTHLSRPLTNAWRGRRNLRNQIAYPRRAHAIFLGDGVSLDPIDGAWQDRYCEPLIAALEAQGQSSVLMQSGDMRRQPCHRPTFAANLVETAGRALAPLIGGELELPHHAKVVKLLAAEGVYAPSLAVDRLARRARIVCATATVFERILASVQPRIAFVVTYYAGLAPAFLLACRRRGVLSVDLQHCPQGPSHKAYRWTTLPRRGFAVLPAVFWTWSAKAAAEIDAWSGVLPWHRGLHGGHPRLAAFLDDDDPQTRGWDEAFHAVGTGCFEREILVTLQTLDGHSATWAALAQQIRACPPDWRWWIRRHPAMRLDDTNAFAGLLSLRGQNIVIDQASGLPLPALLRHMTAVLSLSSGAAEEAAMFGVPAIFLCNDAAARFADLIDAGNASIVDNIANLPARIATLPVSPKRPAPTPKPDINQVLASLNDMADAYAALRAVSGIN